MSARESPGLAVTPHALVFGISVQDGALLARLLLDKGYEVAGASRDAETRAFWQMAKYREGYGLHCASGILFNHESPLRPERFAVQKLVLAARRIADGSRETLELGDLSVVRDWGWAPEYVDAMWRVLQQPRAEDFVVASGNACTLQTVVAEIISQCGLDWRAATGMPEIVSRMLKGDFV